MLHTIKFNVKTILLVIFIFISYQDIRLAIAADEAIMAEKSEYKPIKHMIFPGTSMPELNWWEALWPDPKGVILSFGIEPNMVCVDLCCGYGYFTPILAQSSLRVYGLELDGELLEKARRKSEQQNIKNCLWVQDDAMDLAALIPEKVDFILLASTFHGVPDKEALGKSMLSVLKPQGRLAVVNWHKKQQEETTLFGLPTGPESEMRMAPSEVEVILRPLGFTLQKIIELPPYHYGTIFTKIG